VSQRACPRSSPKRSLKSSLDRRVRVELLPLLDGQHLSKPAPRPVDPALDRPHSHPAYLGGFLVRQTFRPDQEQGLTLVEGNVGQSLAEILEVEPGTLLGRSRKPGCIGAVRVLDLASSLPVLGMKEVAQDREQPGVEVGPSLEAGGCWLQPAPESLSTGELGDCSELRIGGPHSLNRAPERGNEAAFDSKDHQT
jgi:hypothetical protein